MSSKPADANLATLLRYFVGIDLIVETKHGRSLKGSLVSADSWNIVLKNRQKEALTTSATTTTTTTNTGGTESFDWVHIRGPTIRYIVFGANIDLAGVIKAGKDRERAASDKYRRGIRKAPK
jgi:small nuclear ribonucleoprotein (snRNP)-like protein